MKLLFNSLIRENIKRLIPYSCARDEFEAETATLLDANENPYGETNRYPDPYQKKLKNKISEIKKVDSKNIFLGNGSDEIIDICIRIFCRPGIDSVLLLSPTYGMYEVSASIHDVGVEKCLLNNDFQIDFDLLKDTIEKLNPKIIFVCSPNNPTGNIINNLTKIFDFYQGIVFVDEAYIDFAPEKSLLEHLGNYPRMIISQTLSKAWGMAALRIGIAFMNEQLIHYFNKVKPPYNINSLSQQLALERLSDIEKFNNEVEELLSERLYITEELSQMPIVKRIYPSDANFILVEFEDADNIYTYLVSKNVIVRNRSSIIQNCLRITVGTEKENKLLLKELQTYKL